MSANINNYRLNTNDQKATRLGSKGFSLVELNVSITVLSILIVGLLGMFTSFFSLIYRNNITIDMTVESQNLMRTVVEELRYGAGVRDSNAITDANAPADGWNTSNSDFVIIIAQPASDSSDDYIINPDTGTPYLNELVYFKNSDGTLFKRVLAHPDATGNTLTTSCPASAATASCRADKQLVNYVTSMVFTLYDQDDILTTDPLLARSVKIDLTMQRTVFGSPLSLSNSIRITLRNTF